MTSGSPQQRREVQERVVDLIDRDRLPLQPALTVDRLQEALAGHSPVDNAFWEEMADLHNVVLTHDNHIVGAAAYAVREDGTGSIPWLHAAEDPHVIDQLLKTIQKRLADTPKIDAFQHASALSVGLEGLPVEHRPRTHEKLLANGFRGSDLWLYMGGPVAVGAEAVAKVKPAAPDDHATGPAFDLVLREGRRKASEATVGMGSDDLGVLWWIETKPTFRGRGYARKLLRQAMSLLAENGAQNVVLFVDHDDRTGERDRNPAIRLYTSEGFTVVDHLWSYEKGHSPA